MRKNRSFLARVNNYQNVEIDSTASSGSQGKYNILADPGLRLRQHHWIFNVSLFFYKTISWERIYIKKKDTDINAEW